MQLKMREGDQKRNNIGNKIEYYQRRNTKIQYNLNMNNGNKDYSKCNKLMIIRINNLITTNKNKENMNGQLDQQMHIRMLMNKLEELDNNVNHSRRKLLGRQLNYQQSQKIKKINKSYFNQKIKVNLRYSNLRKKLN